MPHRRGVTLIEMVVAIGTVSVVMTLSVMAIMFLLRSEGEGAAALQNSLALSRLARDFRRDVHNARDASADAGNGSLDLHAPERGRVTYHVDGERVVRSVFDSTEPDAPTDQPQGQETYELGDGEVRFEVVSEPSSGSGPLVVLAYRKTLARTPQPNSTQLPTHEYRIAAALARDHRFEKKAEE